MFHSSRRKPGQSLPILALVLVVLVAMIGLSVDVGNAHGQQRRVQNAANASALAAMNSAINKQTNQGVWDNVKRTLAANRIDLSSGEYTIKADYIFNATAPQMIGQWIAGQEVVPNATQTRPDNIIRIQVTITEDVSTYFARVVGRDQLTVNANGNACTGVYGPGVYPMGVPVQLDKTVHSIYAPGSTTPLATTSAVWNQVSTGNWDTPTTSNGPTMVGYTFTIPLGDNMLPGNKIAWIDWTPANSSNSELADALTYPGTLQNGFAETSPGNSTLPASTPNGRLDLLDWVNGTPGARSSNAGELDALEASQRVLILPMYLPPPYGQGSNSSYYITKMGKFKLIDSQLTGSQSSRFMKLQYLGDAAAGIDTCAAEPNPDQTYLNNKRFNVTGTARVERVWRTNQSVANVTNDILLVMDESGSMNFGWTSETLTNVIADRRVTAAKTAISNFINTYDTNADPDARIAFVSFKADSNAGSINSFTSLTNWQTSTQWNTIKTAVNNLNPDGGTPGPFALERAQQVFNTSPATRNGKTVRKVLIFATDGVFNFCGSNPNTSACRSGKFVTCDTDNTTCNKSAAYNMAEPRPVWQGIQLAGQLQSSGVSIYIVALKAAGMDDGGLKDMSSGNNYYLSGTDASSLSNIYTSIANTILQTTCVPHQQLEVATGATVKLTQPTNPSVTYSAVTDSEGRYTFSNLPEGEYVVKSNPFTKRSLEDGLNRTYSRVRNGYNLAEEGQASVSINPQWPNGSSVNSELRLSLPLDATGVSLNGCTTP